MSIPFKKIILVDDDVLTNMLNTKIINAVLPTIEVKVFLDVDDALEYLKTNDQSGDFLIFLDINFPLKSGWDFMDEYAGFAVRSKVYMLSSSIDNADRSKAKSYTDVIDYKTKPFSFDFLESILK